MDFKTGLLLVALAVGCVALPTQPEDDMSIFFEHVDRDSRIVGGDTAPVGSHPHMVAMSNGFMIRSFMCGGSVLTSRTVLTAAHCVEAVYSFGSLSNYLRVTVGTNRWNSGGQTYQLSRNVTHPHHQSKDIKNDIALLITSTAIVFSNTVQPIVLAFDLVGAGEPVKVAGWGRIRAGGAISANLLELSTTTIDGQTCIDEVDRVMQLNNYRDPPTVEPHIEICTFHSAGKGNCNGDSGSALVRTDRGEQVGVVSWGIPCAIGGPDMYVRVSAYVDWFREHIV